jgi:ribosomal protein L7/L12
MIKPDDFGLALNEASRQLQTGGDLEEVLFELRKQGADKIDSIKVLKSAMGITMGQAKSLVDRSDTWSDRFVQDQAFHQMVRDVASKLPTEKNGLNVTVEEDTPDPWLGGKK